MSITGIVKAVKIGFDLTVNVVDTAVSTAELVNQINMAAGGAPFFDEEYRSLTKEMVERGREYENTLREYAIVRTDFVNYQNMVNYLTRRYKSKDQKSEVFNQNIERLRKLESRIQGLMGCNVFLRIFSNEVAEQFHATVNHAELRKQIEERYDMTVTTSGFLMTSVGWGYSAYCLKGSFDNVKKLMNQGKQLPPMRERSNAIIIRNPSKLSRAMSYLRTKWEGMKTIRYAGSFIYNGINLWCSITTFTERLDQLENAKKEMRDHIRKYKRQNRALRILIDGKSPLDSEDRLVLNDVFNKGNQGDASEGIIDIEDETTKKFLAVGYRGTIKEADGEINDIVDMVREIYKEAIQMISEAENKTQTAVQAGFYKPDEVIHGKSQAEELKDRFAVFEKLAAEQTAETTSTTERYALIKKIGDAFEQDVLDRLDGVLAYSEVSTELMIAMSSIYDSIKGRVDTYYQMLAEFGHDQNTPFPPLPTDAIDGIVATLDDVNKHRTVLKSREEVEKTANELAQELAARRRAKKKAA